jgi:hypothetical protein
VECRRRICKIWQGGVAGLSRKTGIGRGGRLRRVVDWGLVRQQRQGGAAGSVPAILRKCLNSRLKILLLREIYVW